MKKLLSLMLALMMLAMPALAEESGVIGGADSATEITVASNVVMPGDLTEKALAAGRRVTSTVSITEVSGIDTGDPTTDAALTDLFNALGLSVAQQGDEFDMSLKISGKDALNLGVAMSGEDVYVKSNLIGGSVVVGKQEVEGLIDRLVEMMIMLQDLSEEEAADFRDQIAQMKQYYLDSLEVSMASALTEEDLKNLNMASVDAFIAFAESKTVPVEEIVVPRMCDPAVSGEKAVLTNADMVQAMKYFYQFILDNPKLMNYLGGQLGFPSEEEIALQWQSMGQFYMAFKIYASEEEFRADNQTFEQYLNTLIADLDTSKVLEGEFVVAEYYDADGNVVYATMSLPLFIQAQTLMETTSAEEAQGELTTINVTYTRQTVADGVAHVCNIDVDGEIITIDVLANEGGMTINMTGVEPEGEPELLAEISVECTESENEAGVQLLSVVGTLFEGADHPILHFVLQGGCEFSDVRSYFGGTLTLTAYEYPAEEEAPAEAADAAEAAVEEDDAATTTTDPAETTEAAEPAESAEPNETTIVIEVSSDYAINGVDFSGATNFAIKVEGVTIAVQEVYETSDPVDSIMAGVVIRPAELDDADFANWFVGAYNALNSWIAELVQALPESVLTLMLTSGTF